MPSCHALRKEPHLGLAEAIDGLHRVAHEEERAARRPDSHPEVSFSQQLQLRVRRVLEFVHEDVADAVVEREQQVGGPSSVSSAREAPCAISAKSALAWAAKTRCSCASARRHQVEDRRERVPLPCAVAARRQALHLAERGAQRSSSLRRAARPAAPFPPSLVRYLRVRDPGVDVVGAAAHASRATAHGARRPMALRAARERVLHRGWRVAALERANPVVALREQRGQQALGLGAVVVEDARGASRWRRPSPPRDPRGRRGGCGRRARRSRGRPRPPRAARRSARAPASGA
jgi:hypothetical protein